MTYGAADFAISATATSGLPVSFAASRSASVYQDTGGTWHVHITGAGSATITAHQFGNGIFAPAADIAQNLTIAKVNAVVVVTPYSVTYDGQVHTATVSITGVNGETGPPSASSRWARHTPTPAPTPPPAGTSRAPPTTTTSAPHPSSTVSPRPRRCSR